MYPSIIFKVAYFHRAYALQRVPTIAIRNGMAA